MIYARILDSNELAKQHELPRLVLRFQFPQAAMGLVYYPFAPSAHPTPKTDIQRH